MFGEPQDLRPKDPAISDLICTNVLSDTSCFSGNNVCLPDLVK